MTKNKINEVEKRKQIETLKNHYNSICKKVFGCNFEFKDIDVIFLHQFHQKLRAKRLVPKASQSLNYLNNLSENQINTLKQNLCTIFKIDNYTKYSNDCDLLNCDTHNFGTNVFNFNNQELKNHYSLICQKVFGEKFKFKNKINDLNDFHNTLYFKKLVPNIGESFYFLQLLSQDQMKQLKMELIEIFNINNKSYIKSIPPITFLKKVKLKNYFKKSNIISQIDYKNKSIECFLKITPKKYQELSSQFLTRKTYSKSNSSSIIYPKNKTKQSNRNHLLPFCLTGIENDFRIVILASSDINDDFCVLEDLYKKMVEQETYIYHTKAYVNKENQLIINQEILDKNLNLLFKKDYVDENYIFDTNIPTIANIK